MGEDDDTYYPPTWCIPPKFGKIALPICPVREVKGTENKAYAKEMDSIS